MAESRKRLSLVHLYRAVAIFLVLFFHANIIYYDTFSYDWFGSSQWFRTGGVDFFFIVSGFMIYYLYHRYIGNKQKAAQFLYKRAVRIYPLYWLFTLAAICIYIVKPDLGDGHELQLSNLWKSLLLYPGDPILKSTWSLSYVVFFYLVFSLIMIKPNIFKPIVVVWLAVVLLANLEIMPPSLADSFLFHISHLQIFTGLFIAYLILNVKPKASLAKIFIPLGILGYLGVWANNIYHYAEIPALYLYWLFAALIMMGITIRDMHVETKLPPMLSLVGDASYSIYITHTLFINFYLVIFKLLTLEKLLGHFISLLLIIVLAVISGTLVYLMLEKPLNRWIAGVRLRPLGQGKRQESL